jgi:AcrR family transcriptional regulator
MPDQPRSRRARAAATRRTILAAAAELFAEHGYAGTTVEAIAERAGYAVQTIYYTFGTKAQLLREMLTSFGARDGEPADTAGRDWVADARSATDARESLAISTRAGADIYRRVAPLYPAILAAVSSEPEVADVWDRVLEAKRDTIRRQMEHLDTLGALRVDVAEATDVSFSLNSIEVYRLLVETRGWDHERFAEWLHTTLVGLLLDEG